MQATGRRQLGLPRSARPGPMRRLLRRRGDRIAAPRVPRGIPLWFQTSSACPLTRPGECYTGRAWFPSAPTRMDRRCSYSDCPAPWSSTRIRGRAWMPRRDRRSRSGSVAGADQPVSVNHVARCPTRSQFGASPRIRWTRPSADQGAIPPGWAVASGAHATHRAGGDLSAGDRTKLVTPATTLAGNLVRLPTRAIGYLLPYTSVGSVSAISSSRFCIWRRVPLGRGRRS